MFDYLVANAPEILRLTEQHFLLSAAGVGLATLIAVPLGVLLADRPRISEQVLAIVDVIQTIPSLALLALLMMVLGIGDATLIAGLVLYSLLPIARNTVAGIRAGDATLIEAARGMGMTEWQVLTSVRMPLALPVILAGIRVALVTAIGITTIGVLFGAGGLGAVIYRGIQLTGSAGNAMVIAGAIPAAGLAALSDAVLAAVERLLTPHVRTVTA
ncbi:MAG: ABC transporter permease [Clostridia bacterium]|nr:ABC transporter permease [Clostridia bacterium]